MADPRFFTNVGPFTLGELADRLGGTLAGGAPRDFTVTDLATLEDAKGSEIAMFGDRRYREAVGCPSWLFAGEHFGDGELAIGAVRNHRLTRLKTELGAIKLYRDDVRLERHQAGNTADLRVGVTIRPCRQTCVTDVEIAAQPFVRAESLVFHGDQLRLVNVGASNVPARCKAGFVEDYGALSVGDNAVMMANHQPSRGLSDVDAVVTVSGMTHDPLIFFVKSLHRRPGERYSCLQLIRVYGQVNVLPRPARSTLLVCPDGIPGCESEVGVPRGMLTAL